MQCSRTVIGWNVNRHLFFLLFSFSLASRRLIPPRCNIEMYCRCCLCGYLVWNVMCHIALGSSQTRRECFRNRLGAQFETIVHIPATFLLLAQTEMAAGIAQDDGKWSEQEVTRFAHLSNGQHNIRSMLTLIFCWFFWDHYWAIISNIKRSDSFGWVCAFVVRPVEVSVHQFSLNDAVRIQSRASIWSDSILNIR